MKFIQYLKEMSKIVDTPDWSYDSPETKLFYYEEFLKSNHKTLYKKNHYELIKHNDDLALLDHETKMIAFISKIEYAFKFNTKEYYKQTELWKEDYTDLKGTALDIFFKYILTRHNMVSDELQTKDAVRFWKSIIQYGLEHNYECGHIDMSNKTSMKYKSIKDYDHDYLHDKVKGQTRHLYIIKK